ncbi:hypothetical protein ACE1OC_41720 (plasmid) [Streptomyces sp. DSM 116496]|uniref:hypothetical protein n=1 Tax=Streptomyces stoeckheimensis TaxID=3344656 RepID=UPI0038B2CDDE
MGQLRQSFCFGLAEGTGEDTLDVDALPRTPTRIIPALGTATPSALLDTEIRVFPGGHIGNTTHPRGYAERLRSLLAPAGA